jgi:hypothetical protein
MLLQSWMPLSRGMTSAAGQPSHMCSSMLVELYRSREVPTSVLCVTHHPAVVDVTRLITTGRLLMQPAQRTDRLNTAAAKRSLTSLVEDIGKGTT